MARPGRIVGLGKKDGAPTKLTPEKINHIEMLAGIGLTIKQICLVTDIAESTLHLNNHANRELHGALERGKAKAQGTIGKALFKKAEAGDVNAIRWWEMTRANRREKVDVESNNTTTITAMTPSERSKRIQELEMKRLEVETEAKYEED